MRLTSSVSVHSDCSEQSLGLNSQAFGGRVVPTGEVTIVFTDITRALALWQFNPVAMRDATLLHNQVLRSSMAHFEGYESTVDEYVAHPPRSIWNMSVG